MTVRRGSVVATAALGVLCVIPTVLPVEPAHAARPSGAAPLPWLRVAQAAGGRPQIVDAAGRTVMLRGPNLRGIEDDFYPVPGGGEPGPTPQYTIDPAAYDGTCPAARPGAGEPPTCEVAAGRPEYQQPAAIGSEDDLAEIRAQGFDFIRLTLSWSLLEPAPGQYSSEYLDRVAQVVGWASEQGIYVLLDMHQDDYSRFVPDRAPVSLPPVLGSAPESPNHADGAPPWAVITTGVPAEAVAGIAEFNLAVESAFTSFWLNRVPSDGAGHPLPTGAAPGPGLQDHYIGALAALARRFRSDSAVVGYEIMNEPLPGAIAPIAFSSGYLFPFYRRVIDALTGTSDGVPCAPGLIANPLCGYRDLGVHTRQAFFFEPMAIRNLEDAPDQIADPFSSYPNLVYAPHDYTHVFTVDREIGLSPSQSPYPLSYDQPYQVADAEARVFRAALVVDEYGEFSGNPTIYEEVITGMTAAQDRFVSSSSYWAWTGQSVSPLLTRVYPGATAGTLRSFGFDPASRSFAMTATSARAVPVGERARETQIVIPADVGGAVSVTGAARIDLVVENPDGTRTAYIAPTGAGSYGVKVG